MRKITLVLILISLLAISGIANGSQQTAVPILMYHSVANIKNNPAVISPANFEKQMKYLSDNGYTPITLDELHAYLTQKNYKLPKKPVVITFDDGYRDTYTTALPILKKYGFKSTLFLIANKVDKKVFTRDELNIMKKNGMAIYNHTYNHPSLKQLNTTMQEREIVNAEKKITSLNGKKSNYFCYPYGHYNKTTLSLLKKHGYKMAFSNKPGWVKKGDNLYTLKRIYIGNSVTLASFKERVTKPNYKLGN